MAERANASQVWVMSRSQASGVGKVGKDCMPVAGVVVDQVANAAHWEEVGD